MMNDKKSKAAALQVTRLLVALSATVWLDLLCPGECSVAVVRPDGCNWGRLGQNFRPTPVAFPDGGARDKRSGTCQRPRPRNQAQEV